MTINDLDMGIACEGLDDGLDEKCTTEAVYAVTQHRLGHCNLGMNVVRMLCPQHTAMVLQVNAFVDAFACARCGKIFHVLHDLVQVEHLVTGAGLDG
jgi:hypothetical protein